MKKIFILTVILNLCLSHSVYANNKKFDSLITAGIHQIYNIKFDQAQKTFSKIIRDFPSQPAGYFFDAMILWWKILLDLENENLDDQFIDKLDFVIEFCDKILNKNPNHSDAIFFKGGSLGFRGRLYAIRESWFNAALDGKDALPLVNKAYEVDPNNIDLQLGFGIYNYYADVIPQKYSFVKPFMSLFPKGDKKKGLEQLNLVSNKGKYAKYEATYFLAMLYYSYEENNWMAMEYIDKLVNEFPDNPRFERMMGRVWVKQNNYSEASKVFRNVIGKTKLKLPGYDNKALREAYYYLAMDYKKKIHTDSSRVYFEMCEDISRKLDKDEETGFLINSSLYLGNIYDEMGLRNLAVQKYKEVLDYREYNQSHTLAEKYLKNPFTKKSKVK